MSTTLLTRERKRLLIAGGVLLLFGLIYRVYPVLGSFLPDSDELVLKARTISKYQARNQERPRLQERVLSLTRRLERTENELLPGATPALAAVNIQNLINEIVSNNGLTVDSLLVIKPVESDVKGYLEIAVQVNMKLNVGQLLDLLYRIESAPRLLSIGELRLRRLETAAPDMLSAVFTVAGYMKKTDQG